MPMLNNNLKALSGIPSPAGPVLQAITQKKTGMWVELTISNHCFCLHRRKKTLVSAIPDKRGLRLLIRNQFREPEKGKQIGDLH